MSGNSRQVWSPARRRSWSRLWRYIAGRSSTASYLGSSVFDDWAAGERDRLLSRALESLEKLARLVDVETGLVLADRLLAMEPTREASYWLKIELLAASGQRDRAMRTFEACRSMLKKEFGVGVSPETRASVQSVLSSDDTASTSALPAAGKWRPGRQAPWASVHQRRRLRQSDRRARATTISPVGSSRTSPRRSPR